MPWKPKGSVWAGGMPITVLSGTPSATSSSCTIIERRNSQMVGILRGGIFRVQDFFSLRAHRADLPYLRAALALEPGFRLLDMGGGTGAYTAVFAAGCEEIVVL